MQTQKMPAEASTLVSIETQSKDTHLERINRNHRELITALRLMFAKISTL